jgi:site-specific DNA-methyltransferase (adenine-specific)
MPESVTDRPTKSHEYVFLLSKSPQYFYDGDAIREPVDMEYLQARTGGKALERKRSDAMGGLGTSTGDEKALGGSNHVGVNPAGRNKRSVWSVATQPYPGAHFAVFPPKLIEPCVLAGCPERCCAGCGAPWVRVSEREEVHTRERERNVGGFTSSCACDAGTTAGTVLDPFAGAGTGGVVALRLNRSFVGIELNPGYAEQARQRIRDDAPLMNTVSEIAG